MTHREIHVARHTEEDARTGCGCGVVLGLAIAGGALAAIARLLEGDPGILGYVLIGAAALGTIIGLYIIYFSVQNRLAKRRLGEVEIEAVPRGAQGIDFMIAFAPPAGLRLTEVSLSVWCDQSSGADDHEVFRFDDLLADEQTIIGTDRLEFRSYVEIPPDAPPTNHDSDVLTLWNIEVRIGIFKWPDHVEKLNLELVAPGTPSSSETAPNSPHVEW